jgi:hypothetical protein
MIGQCRKVAGNGCTLPLVFTQDMPLNPRLLGGICPASPEPFSLIWIMTVWVSTDIMNTPVYHRLSGVGTRRIGARGGMTEWWGARLCNRLD